MPGPMMFAPRRRGVLVVLSLALFAGPAALARQSAGVPSGHWKKGVASARYLASDPARLAGLGASWAYDWSATAPARVPGLQWVPMVWGAGSVTPSVLRSLRTDRRTGRAQALLGFNEPDSGAQSNMSPVQAAALWPALERTGLKLGSPAPQVPTDGWLARFMALARVRHLRVDFIAVHYYQDFTNPDAVASLRSQLVALHRQFGKPIWVTEIGAIDLRSWGEPMLHTPTTGQADAYMRRLFTMLDGLAFVQRYAWFTDKCSTDNACRYSSLFTAPGRRSSAGATFASAP